MSASFAVSTSARWRRRPRRCTRPASTRHARGDARAPPRASRRPLRPAGAIRVRRAPPSTARRTPMSLDGSREQPLHEVALEGEEDAERHEQRDERRRRDQVDIRPELAQVREDRHRNRLNGLAERERDDEVVPRPDELEHGDRRERREREWQHDAHEDPQLRGAVDPRRLEELLRDPDEVVAEQEDRERKPEGDVEEDDPRHGVVQPDVVVEREHRDQRHLQRDDEQADHHDEDPVAAGELEPREGVARKRREKEDDRRIPDRDLGGCPQRRHDRMVLQDRAVVRPRREARMREDLPPSFDGEALRRKDRRQEQAGRRDEPQQPEPDERDVDGRAGGEPERSGCRALGHGSLLKRRMLSMSTGTTSRNRNTAIAEPTPKSSTPPNDSRHIASAITFAASCEDPGASVITRSNTFRTLMIIVMKTTESTGASNGTVT